MFVGYVVNPKVYDLKNKSVFVSRDVVFYENQFPFKGYSAAEQPWFTDVIRLYLDEQVDVPLAEHEHSATDTIDNISFKPADQNDNTDNVEDGNVRRSVRTRGPPIWHRDYAMTCSNTLYPISNFVDYYNLSKGYQCFLSSISKCSEPSSYEQAAINENWVRAMEDEI